MWNNRLQRTLRAPIVLVAAVGLAVLSGCSGVDGPGEPDGPDLSTVTGALLALTDAYSFRDLETARLLHSPSFRFVPALPDSVSFLGTGETEWGSTWEDEILSRLLVPGRTSWIDQVLLEIERLQTTPTANGVIVEAKTELIIIVGPVDLMRSRSIIEFVYEKDAQGRHILMEQRESIFPQLGNMTVGQLKSLVEAPPEVEARDPVSVGVNNAVLAARVNANGLPSTYYFEWGTDTSYGSVTPTTSAGEDTFPIKFHSTLMNLDPATEYHYRMVASSLWGTTRGEDRMFTTLP